MTKPLLSQMSQCWLCICLMVECLESANSATCREADLTECGLSRGSRIALDVEAHMRAHSHSRSRTVSCLVETTAQRPANSRTFLARFGHFRTKKSMNDHLNMACHQKKNVATHMERTRRITNEHARAEGHVNDGIGSLGQAVQAAAKATHSLTCGVPDRESNEVKYLREATELIEAWQHQLLSGQPMSGPPSEHSEVILVERQR